MKKSAQHILSQSPSNLSYEEYLAQQQLAFEEELDDDSRCFPAQPEGQFVRSH